MWATSFAPLIELNEGHEGLLGQAVDLATIRVKCRFLLGGGDDTGTHHPRSGEAVIGPVGPDEVVVATRTRRLFRVDALSSSLRMLNANVVY